MDLTNCELYQGSVTPTRFARLLGWHYNTVYAWKKSGKIPFVETPGGRWRIPISELEKLAKGPGAHNPQAHDTTNVASTVPKGEA